MVDGDDRYCERDLTVNVHVTTAGVVTTAVAVLDHDGHAFRASREARAYPQTPEMGRVRGDLAVGRALAELARQLQVTAAEEYVTAGNPDHDLTAEAISVGPMIYAAA